MCPKINFFSEVVFFLEEEAQREKKRMHKRGYEIRT
jgi:hypothetical protein